MEHKFSENYNESAFPVSDKGSLVIPIPKGELDLFERPWKIGKIWSNPSEFWNAAGPKAELHPVSAEEGFLKPPTLAVVQTKYFPPQATLIALPENSPEEDNFMVLPGTKAITERQPDKEVVTEDSCIMDTKMDTGVKPKGPLLVAGEGRNSNHRRKRAAGKNRKLYLLCWMVFMCVPVSEGFPGAQPAADQKLKCFTCMDKDRCLKLMTISSTYDTPVYKRDLNQTFPGCSEISPPTPKSCAVCRDQLKITIICSDDVGGLELEDSDGGQILNISSVCAQPAADQKLKCFTCMDKDRCLKLMTIYGTYDTPVYKRDLNQTFPGCSEISPPTPKSCAVCRDQLMITIICSDDVGGLELEDSDGVQILNISSVCAQPAADQKLKCFTCMDKDRCLKLMTISSTYDTPVYKRDLNQTFPGCSEISPPTPKSCAVCRDQLKITIICSDDVGGLELEDSDGGQILNISSVCVQQQTRGYVGLILSAVVFLIVVTALVIRCWQKKQD
ncbi:uncharacterized protein LOC122881748 isoform X2 [Siniperca chuatsi]|nr:uncharacterized protein LOC122881748 isoform X2 [Siniperca chuatsi]